MPGMLVGGLAALVVGLIMFFAWLGAVLALVKALAALGLSARARWPYIWGGKSSGTRRNPTWIFPARPKPTAIGPKPRLTRRNWLR